MLNNVNTLWTCEIDIGFIYRQKEILFKFYILYFYFYMYFKTTKLILKQLLMKFIRVKCSIFVLRLEINI